MYSPVVNLRSKYPNCEKGKMNMRTVKIKDPMTQDCMVIITNAPVERIREWIGKYNREMEDGKNTYFDDLKKDFYVRVLFDSMEDPVVCETLIDVDEVYDLNTGDMSDSFKTGKAKLLGLVMEAVEDNGMQVLDDNDDSLTVANHGIGPDFKVTVTIA